MTINDEPLTITLRVNGAQYNVDLEPRVSLLDLLRERLRLTGTKKGCNQGACGACTVLVDGTRINSCLALAVAYADTEITTIEGLAGDEGRHPLQSAFVEHDGLQCGYCTPGQILSAIGMAAEVNRGMPSTVDDTDAPGGNGLTDLQVRERMSGNLCRCGAQNGILAAIQQTLGHNP